MLALVANSALSYQATGLKSSIGRSGVVMQVGKPLELSGDVLGVAERRRTRLHSAAPSSVLAGEIQGDSLPERCPGA
jgi:hypothetical protein